ncbi:hypothetical protein BGY98DRAFT_1009253 [Russula aff. rugulosa BPL654]|nr:hypothetical protein BGY98DRAFT_1009253 [Russula aff. rugulosa BPL654]
MAAPYILTFDPSRRSVVVPRNRCSDYDGIITVAQHNVRNLRFFSEEDSVLLALIPGYPDKKEVEVSKEAWPVVSAAVQSVTIALESGASPMASRPFPRHWQPLAADIDQPVLLLFDRVAVLGRLGARSGSTVTGYYCNNTLASPHSQKDVISK